MKTSRFVLILTFVMALLLGGSRFFYKWHRDFVGQLELAAEKALQSKQLCVDLGSVAAFAWDRLFLFGPYTPITKIRAQIGDEWPGAAETGIQLSETFSLLVFVHQGRVVKAVKAPRSMDFRGIESTNGYARAECWFTVERIGDGADVPRMVLRPKGTRVGALEPPARQ